MAQSRTTLEVPAFNANTDKKDDLPVNSSHLTPRLFRRHQDDIPHMYNTDHPHLVLSELEHGNNVVAKSFRRLESDGNLAIPKHILTQQDSLAVGSSSSSHPNSIVSNNNSEDISSASEMFRMPGRHRRRSSLFVFDGNKVSCIQDTPTSSEKLKRTGFLGIRTVKDEKKVDDDFFNWLSHISIGGEVYNPLYDECEDFWQQLFQPYSSYRCYAYLTRAQECCFFMLGVCSLLLFLSFLISSSHMKDKPFSSTLSLLQIGLCYMLPSYITMLTCYVYRGSDLPIKAFGIPALLLKLGLAIATACLIFLEISVPTAVWYVLLIILGASAGVFMSVLHIMTSLFPGGRSVCMMLWGIGFAFLLPALGELAFILLHHFSPDIDWVNASRYKTCAVFILTAFFIFSSIYGLHVLTCSGIFKLFKGKKIFSHRNDTEEDEEQHRIHWSDTWGFLVLQFATAGITMYILVGANTVAITTKSIVPKLMFYDELWETFHASFLVAAFLCGGFFGICVTVMSRFKTVLDSYCAIVSLFIPSFLRIGLLVVFIIYIRDPFLTSHGVLTIVLYFFTAFSDVIIQNSLASYCQKLGGYIPKKLVNCNIAQVCLMIQLLGATTGAALSFIEL